MGTDVEKRLALAAMTYKMLDRCILYRLRNGGAQHPERGWCGFGLIRSSHEDSGPLDDLANYCRLRVVSLQGADELG